MVMKKALLACSLAAALGFSGAPSQAAPWERGFVVSEYVFGFHFGGRADFSKEGEFEPGLDCPTGSTRNFTYDNGSFYEALILAPWRTEEEIRTIMDPPGGESVNNYLQTRSWVNRRAISYRGYAKGIATYVNPFAAADPGQPEVTGLISEGFDLDGDPDTGGFISPDGEKGIDNALYRAWGCTRPYRGDNATLNKRATSQMLEGLYTAVIRLSGNQDPMNDSDVTLEIGYSPDKIQKDSAAGVARNYSYRIFNGTMYSKVKARIKDGIVDTGAVDRLHAPTYGWFANQVVDGDFHKGRIRFAIDAKGNVKGHIGGYRDWRDIYAANTFGQDGAQQDNREHQDSVALYHAILRNADGLRDPQTRRKMGISTAYRFTAVPAQIVDPLTPITVEWPGGRQNDVETAKIIRAAFVKAIATRAPQELPWQTGEAVYPGLERVIFDLPNGMELWKMLDRPRNPNEPDWYQEYLERREAEKKGIVVRRRGFDDSGPSSPATAGTGGPN
jgi:hypothetical protein